MNAGRLVIVCGAGLSMAPPSNLPSAARVAEMCFDKYQLTANANCNPALRDDLGSLAEHFAALGLGTLKSVFIESLVPWRDFVRPSNAGHASIADFLITRAAVAGLSSNYDTLIEHRAKDYGFDFRSALDGDEANVHARTQGPFLKFHGCADKDRTCTVWAPSQLHADATIARRITSCTTWMAANLRQKDLLVVGFWSDWGYLNQIVGSALQGVDPLSVTVVDLSGADQLQNKAPELWALSHVDNVEFHHVQESGAEALDELRREFSKNYLRQVIDAGKVAFEQETGTACDPAWLAVADFDSETLYSWRRDAEGVPAIEPAIRRQPGDCQVLGFFHLLIRRAGAQPHAQGYELHGRIVRVINGAERFLEHLQCRFVEAPAALTADIVVAVGAIVLGRPDNIVRDGRVGDFIRPKAGGERFDFDGARAELNI